MGSTTSQIPIKKEKVWKFVIIGEFAVGVTCICNRILHDEFRHTYATIGVVHHITVEELGMQIQFWELKGNSRYWSDASEKDPGVYIKMHFRGVDGMIMVYDITSSYTLRNLYPIFRFKQMTGCDAMLLILGNKKDLNEEREVTFEAGSKVANEFGALFEEVSAKSGEGVKEAWDKFLRIVKNREEVELSQGIYDEGKKSGMDFPAELSNISVEELLQPTTISAKSTSLDNMDCDTSLKFISLPETLPKNEFYKLPVQSVKLYEKSKCLKEVTSLKAGTLQYPNVSNVHHIFKIMFVGDAAVGKTSILRRILNDKYKEKHMPTSVDSFERMVDVQGTKFLIKFCDTGGDEKLQRVAVSYVESSNAVVIVYDVTKEESLHNVQSWIRCVKERSSEDTMMLVIGSKIDLCESREVSSTHGEQIAHESKTFFCETSSKTGEGIEEVRNAILKMLQTKADRPLM